MYSVMAKSLMDPILPSQKQMNCKFLIKFKVGSITTQYCYEFWENE